MPVLEQIVPTTSLQALVARQKLSYFGHAMRGNDRKGDNAGRNRRQYGRRE